MKSQFANQRDVYISHNFDNVIPLQIDFFIDVHWVNGNSPAPNRSENLPPDQIQINLCQTEIQEVTTPTFCQVGLKVFTTLQRISKISLCVLFIFFLILLLST